MYHGNLKIAVKNKILPILSSGMLKPVPLRQKFPSDCDFQAKRCLRMGLSFVSSLNLWTELGASNSHFQQKR
jgi:hypothetical protein